MSGARGFLSVAATALTVLAGIGAATSASAQWKTPPGAAPALSCGSLHVAARGDTLFKIAEAAYGDGWKFPAVLAANRDLLSAPEQLEVGDVLLLPCLDGSGPQTRADAVAALRAKVAAEEPGTDGALALVPARVPALPSARPDTAPVAGRTAARIVLGRDAAPLVGADRPEGGVLAETLARALWRAPAPVAFEIVFEPAGSAEASATDSATAHVTDKTALSFPSLRPDCARPARLGDAARALCASHVYSAPLMEIEYTVYAASGFPRTESLAALAGQRICRPAGEMTEDLAHAGLTGPDTTLLRAASAGDCLRLVMAGEADVASVTRPDARIALAVIPTPSFFREIVALRARHGLHLSASADDPEGTALIAALDAGLALMRRTGEHQAVLAAHGFDSGRVREAEALAFATAPTARR